MTHSSLTFFFSAVLFYDFSSALFCGEKRHEPHENVSVSHFHHNGANGAIGIVQGHTISHNSCIFTYVFFCVPYFQFHTGGKKSTAKVAVVRQGDFSIIIITLYIRIYKYSRTHRKLYMFTEWTGGGNGRIKFSGEWIQRGVIALPFRHLKWCDLQWAT